MNTTIEDAASLRDFDGVVLATGVFPRPVTLAGRDLPHVVSYADVLLNGRAVGERVAIVGAGGIGVDVAHYLSFGEANVDESTRFLYEQGLAAPANGAIFISARKQVALLRRGGTIGAGIGKTTRWAVMRALRAAGVETLPNIAYERIVPGGIEVRTADGDVLRVEADTVVIAAGQDRNDVLLEPLRALGVPFRVVGGAKDASELNAVRAFEDGLRAAHELAREATRFNAAGRPNMN